MHEVCTPAESGVFDKVRPILTWAGGARLRLHELRLFCVTARGELNVRAGRHANPTIGDEPNLRALGAALRRPGVELRVSGFDRALEDAGRDDFVYLDPPYAPVSGTARFTSYTSGGF